jgi:hypothetical protein
MYVVWISTNLAYRRLAAHWVMMQMFVWEMYDYVTFHLQM